MAEIRLLAPHDPLPEEPSVGVLRRFDEDRPGRTVLELMIHKHNGTHETRLLTRPDGTPATLEQALHDAEREAAGAGLTLIWHLDRTGGPLEREVLQRHGDHSFTGLTLDDDDLEDGEHGPDMRDRGNDGGPRRF